MNYMFRSATFRLTMYYLGIIAVITIGFSTALYHVALHDLQSGLQQQTRQIYDNFPVFIDSPYLSSVDAFKASRDHLLGRIVLSNILVLIGAGFASYALARRTLQPIEAAHERQKRFTADVSHELRTPLTSLKMESEVALLDTKASKQDLRDVLQSNVEEVEKLTNLVQNLLRISKLDAGDNAKLFSAISLDSSVKAAIDQVQPIAASRHIVITYKKPRTRVIIQGDESTLTQLFSILIENAVKYSPSKSHIVVELQQADGLATVSVTDQGQGIAKDDLMHVFERFYRADAARSAGDQGGFGLGLSIAKLIADSHNATIQISSRQGKGTTAKVLLATSEETIRATSSPRSNKET